MRHPFLLRKNNFPCKVFDTCITRLIFLVLVLLISNCSLPVKRDWHTVDEPTNKKGEVYGSYSAGCLDGAISLSASSLYFQAMRPSRKRYYGHPDLIQFLEEYSKTLYDKGLGSLAIGDLSQARGGPMSSGHASHQLGLDADIWFLRFTESEKKALSLHDTESIPATTMVNDDSISINQNNWHKDNTLALKFAAINMKVERVFVNYVIKKALCESHKGEKWLSKIRPWWGHTYHYHVRLACPNNSLYCNQQNPVTQTDGCDETLDWWYSEEALQTREKKSMKEASDVKLPLQCEKVLQSDSMRN